MPKVIYEKDGKIARITLNRPEVFNAIALKATYIQKLKRVGLKLEYSIGVKNLTNAYQNNFDSLKERDSNFIYGPSNPRTFYFGLTLKSL